MTGMPDRGTGSRERDEQAGNPEPDTEPDTERMLEALKGPGFLKFGELEQYGGAKSLALHLGQG